MLSRKDKNIIRYGTFMEQTSLLIDHFEDKSKRWIIEARKYFYKCNPNLFKSSTSQSEGTELTFKVPSQSSDKHCLTDSKYKPLTDSKSKILTGNARL